MLVGRKKSVLYILQTTICILYAFNIWWQQKVTHTLKNRQLKEVDLFKNA